MGGGGGELARTLVGELLQMAGAFAEELPLPLGTLEMEAGSHLGDDPAPLGAEQLRGERGVAGQMLVGVAVLSKPFVRPRQMLVDLALGLGDRRGDSGVESF